MKKWSIWFLSAILAFSFLVWTINIFCGSDTSDKGYIMSEKLIQELNAIDRNAEEMAESVLKNPLLRKGLEKKSEILEERLLYLAEELERIDPAAYKMTADQVSEALLDLAFVQMDTESVSLRLGQVVEQQRLEDRDKAKDVLTEKAEPTVGLGVHTPQDPDQNVEALREVLDRLKGPD